MKRSEIVNELLNITTKHKILWKSIPDGYSTVYKSVSISVLHTILSSRPYPKDVDRLYSVKLNGLDFYSDISVKSLYDVIRDTMQINEQKHLDRWYSMLFDNNCDA